MILYEFIIIFNLYYLEYAITVQQHGFTIVAAAILKT